VPTLLRHAIERRSISSLDRFCFLVLLLYFTQAQWTPWDEPEFRSPSALNVVGTAIGLGIYCLALFPLRTRIRCVTSTMWENWLVLSICVLAVSSTLWSSSPELTLRRSLWLGATTLVGFLYGRCQGTEQQSIILARCILAVAVLSLLLAVLLPGFGVEQDVHSGDWKGIFSQKNVLGRIMSLGVVLSLTGPFAGRRVVCSTGMFLVCSFLLFKSGSRTAIAITIIVALLVACWYLCRRLPLYAKLATIALGLALAISAYALVGTDVLLRLADRDSTLTGRTDIWEAAVTAGESHWLFGYGFSAVWLGPYSTIGDHIFDSTAHAHNGFLNLMLELGAIGLFLFLALITKTFLREVRRLTVAPSPVHLWRLAFVIWLILYNCAESTGPAYNDLFWMLAVAISIEPETAEGHQGSHSRMVQRTAHNLLPAALRKSCPGRLNEFARPSSDTSDSRHLRI